MAALADIDNEVVLPIIKPLLSSISLPEITRRAEELITQQVTLVSITVQVHLLMVIIQDAIPSLGNIRSTVGDMSYTVLKNRGDLRGVIILSLISTSFLYSRIHWVSKHVCKCFAYIWISFIRRPFANISWI